MGRQRFAAVRSRHKNPMCSLHQVSSQHSRYNFQDVSSCIIDFSSLASLTWLRSEHPKHNPFPGHGFSGRVSTALVISLTLLDERRCSAGIEYNAEGTISINELTIVVPKNLIVQFPVVYAPFPSSAAQELEASKPLSLVTSLVASLSLDRSKLQPGLHLFYWQLRHSDRWWPQGQD